MSRRAGRDGAPARCVLFLSVSVLPSLLPSPGRSEEAVRQCRAMLAAVHEYAVATADCRRAVLLRYFGENVGAGGNPSGDAETDVVRSAVGGARGVSAAAAVPADAAPPRGRGAVACCDVCDGAAHLPPRPQTLLAAARRLLREVGRAGGAAGEGGVNVASSRSSVDPLCTRS